MIVDKDIVISETKEGELIYKYSDEHDDKLRERFCLNGTNKMKFNITEHKIFNCIVPSFYNCNDSDEEMIRSVTENFLKVIGDELHAIKSNISIFNAHESNKQIITWLEEKSGLSYVDLYKVIRQFIYEHQDGICYDEDDSGHRYNYELDIETTEKLRHLTNCIPPILRDLPPTCRRYSTNAFMSTANTTGYEHSYSPMDEIYDMVKESLGLGVDKELRVTNSEVIHIDGNSVQLKLTCELKGIGDE